MGSKEAFSDADRAAYIAAWSQPGALTGGLNYYRAARVGPPTSDAAPDASGAFGDWLGGPALFLR